MFMVGNYGFTDAGAQMRGEMRNSFFISEKLEELKSMFDRTTVKRNIAILSEGACCLVTEITKHVCWLFHIHLGCVEKNKSIFLFVNVP